MAHKTFISYKYSEAQQIREILIEAMGDDATYYKGETADSPDLTSDKVDTIKKRLAQQINDTSVTIVVISPHMRPSKWIEWEIKHSLRIVPFNGSSSRTNGIIGVIAPANNSYGIYDFSWFRESIGYPFLHQYKYNDEFVLTIISENRNNRYSFTSIPNSTQWPIEQQNSYISYVTLNEFRQRPSYYVELAYEKSLHTDAFYIVKQ